MNRRSFMKGILAAGVAPYVVTTAGVLMPVKKLWTPLNYSGSGTITYRGLVGYPLMPGDFVRVDIDGVKRVARVENVIEHILGASATLVISKDDHGWVIGGEE